MSNVKSHLNKSGVTLEWITIILIFAIFILILLGCAGNFASRDLKNLYVSEFKDVREEEPLRPVIFIPGILGSILVEKDDPNDEIWGSYFDMLFSNLFGKGFDKLYLDPGEYKLNGDENGIQTLHYGGKNKIISKSVMEKVGLSDFFVIDASDDIGIYKTFLNLLRKDLGYGDKKRGIDDLFFFHYDWRLDNAENAVNLGREIVGWKKDYIEYVKKNYPNYDIQDVKFNIIAHSMGGIIAMYYALKLEGLQNIGKLILIATPLQGSMVTVKALKDGEDIGFALYVPKHVAMSFPALYQMLPDYDTAFVDDSGKEIAKNIYDLESFENWVGFPEKNEKIGSSDQQEFDEFIHKAIKQAQHVRDTIKLEKLKEAAENEKIDVLIIRSDCDKTLFRAIVEKNELMIPIKNVNFDGLRSHVSGDGRVPSYELKELKRSKYISVIYDCGNGHAYVMEKSITVQNSILRSLLPEGHFGQ